MRLGITALPHMRECSSLRQLVCQPQPIQKEPGRLRKELRHLLVPVSNSRRSLRSPGAFHSATTHLEETPLAMAANLERSCADQAKPTTHHELDAEPASRLTSSLSNC